MASIDSVSLVHPSAVRRSVVSRRYARRDSVRRRLLAAADAGGLVNLRVGVAELDQPAKGATWEAARTVRA
nr:hypothetical protein [Actinomycetota bacterium]